MDQSKSSSRPKCKEVKFRSQFLVKPSFSSGPRYMICITLFLRLILACPCVFWLVQRAKTCDKIWYLRPLPSLHQNILGAHGILMVKCFTQIYWCLHFTDAYKAPKNKTWSSTTKLSFCSVFCNFIFCQMKLHHRSTLICLQWFLNAKCQECQ